MLRIERNGTVVCDGKIVHSPRKEYVFEVVNTESSSDKNAIKLRSLEYSKYYLAICSDQITSTVSLKHIHQSE